MNKELLIVGDKVNVVEYVAHRYNIPCTVVNPTKRNLQDYVEQFCVQNNYPLALWIQWHVNHGPIVKTHHFSYLSALAKLIEHCKEASPIIMEGKHCHFPQQDSAFQQLITNKFNAYTILHWCGMAIQTRQNKPLCGKHGVLSHPDVKSVRCVCRTSNKHKYVSCADSGYEQFCVKMLQTYGIIPRDKNLPISTLWHMQQREDKTNLRIEAAVQTEAYPTAAAEAQKSARKAIEEQLRAEGKDEEIKALRKRKAQPQEQHYDDCGSDVEPLKENDKMAMLTLSNQVTKACFFDDPTYSNQPDYNYLLGMEFELAYMLGSAVDESSFWYKNKTSDAKFVKFIGLLSYLAGQTRKKCVDVVEICGGVAGVSKISIRNQLKAGPNFDIVTGCDLTLPHNQMILQQYISEYQPLVVVMAPPCTAFSGWAHMNEHLNHPNWQKQRIIGEKLGNLCARIAKLQLEHDRHFLVENPTRSELFKLRTWQSVMTNSNICKVNFPQCAVGLVDPKGTPMQKVTTLIASDERIIKSFRTLKCCHSPQDHVQIQGNLSKWAQVWPLSMCKKIVMGIQSVSKDRRKVYALTLFCTGCKHHIYKEHPSHDRRPGHCKFPDVISEKWKCSKCANPNSKQQHTGIELECRNPVPKLQHGRVRQGATVRDPSVPATGSHVGRRNMADPEDLEADGVHADPLSKLSEEEIDPFQNPIVPSTPTQWDEDAPSSTLQRFQGTKTGIRTPEPTYSPGSDDEKAEVPTDYESADTESSDSSTDGANDEDSDKSDGTEEIRHKREMKERKRVERKARKVHKSKVKLEDSSTQAGKGDDWKSFDANKAITILKSDNPDIRRRSLMRLHIRWYHATIQEMTNILRAAGVDARALSQIPSVCQGCNVCRDWKKPGPKCVAAFRLTTKFNEEVQFDLLFYRPQHDAHGMKLDKKGNIIIAHCIDTCTRWSCAEAVNSKHAQTLLSAISNMWLKTFGPMDVLTLDNESGMKTDAAGDWASANRVELKYKAPRQKAWIVERHNAIVRETLQKTESQLVRDNIKLPFVQILAIVMFMKNALTVINTSTPYQAVLGRQPAMLPPLEGGHVQEYDDETQGPNSELRHQAKVRELAAINMIEVLAKWRIQRASKSRTRGAMNLKEINQGDIVDLWIKPEKKGVEGWRGPGQVIEVNSDEGNVSIRYQGRIRDRKAQEVRLHIPYLVFLSASTTHLEQWRILKSACEEIPYSTSQVYGVIQTDGKKPGWYLTKRSQTKEGKQLLEAGLILSNVGSYMERCTTVRLARGAAVLQPLKTFRSSEIWIWTCGSTETPDIFHSEDNNLNETICVKTLAKELEDVHRGQSKWQDCCIVQFLCVNQTEVTDIIQKFPHVPLIADSGNPPPFELEDKGNLTPKSMDTSRSDKSMKSGTSMSVSSTSTSYGENARGEKRTKSEASIHTNESTGMPEKISRSEPEDPDDIEMCLWKKELLDAIARDDGQETELTEEEQTCHFISECVKPPLWTQEMWYTEPTETEVYLVNESLQQSKTHKPTTIEIDLESVCAKAWLSLHTPETTYSDDDTVTLIYDVATESLQSVQTKAGKTHMDLTPLDIQQNFEDVKKAKIKELTDLYELGTFVRMLRSQAKNIVDTRWVLTWKLGEDALRKIKARFTMRGFKDRQEWMETFAGTASRWSQRLINSVCCTHANFELYSIDVSVAFAKGMTFEELAKYTGEPVRSVEFELHPNDVIYLRALPDFGDFNPATEVLTMIKPIYGLKDAPRAWRKKLDTILVEFGLVSLYAEPEIYIHHDEKGNLLCILTTHVDDLKCASSKEYAMKLIDHIESKVGTVKQQWDNFTHTGVIHEKTKEGIKCHQDGYISSLTGMDTHGWNEMNDETEVTGSVAASYLSVLGAVAWTVITRADVCIYVQALQRRAHKPRVVDCKKLNLVVRYLKRYKCSLWYAMMDKYKRVVCWSDSAFKAIPDEGSGLAIRGTCIVLQDSEELSCMHCHLIEFLARRQKRVVRSTFSAELNGLLDNLEQAILVQIAVHEVMVGTKRLLTNLKDDAENGKLQPGLDCVVDARALFDAVASADPCTPLECSLKLHLLDIRDKLARGIIQKLHWADTRDMVADCMTKGGVLRTMIQNLSEKGIIKVAHDIKTHCKLRSDQTTT